MPLAWSSIMTQRPHHILFPTQTHKSLHKFQRIALKALLGFDFFEECEFLFQSYFFSFISPKKKKIIKDFSCFQSMKPASRSFNKFWLLWLFWSLLKPLPRLPSVNAFSSPKNKPFSAELHNGLDLFFSSLLVSVLRHNFFFFFGWNWKQILPHIAMHFLLHFMVAIYFQFVVSIRCDRNINLIDKFNLTLTLFSWRVDDHFKRMEFRGWQNNWARIFFWRNSINDLLSFPIGSVLSAR